MTAVGARSAINLALIACFFVLQTTTGWGAQPVSVAVTLNPTGEFEVTSQQITGALVKDGERYTAKEIAVPIDALVTSMELRDKHLREKLGWPDEKHVIARNLEITKDSGKGTLTLNKLTKPLSFKVTDQTKDSITATFPLRLADYGIKGVRYLNVGVEDEVLVTVTVPYGK